MDEAYAVTLANGEVYPYQIVHSKRAKYIRLKLTLQGKLSVTLPAKVPLKQAHEFVFAKTDWIERNLSKIIPLKTKTRPEYLELLLLDQTWHIKYTETIDIKGKLSLRELPSYHLEISGDADHLNDLSQIRTTLSHWCKHKARPVFNRMLQKQAELHGFHYQRLSVRSQKTRWGSCSHHKNINLNCKLLFMPEDIVKYVMIHELCHTIEMNHSKNFWNLVEDCQPNYKTHKKELKRLGHGLPI